MRGSSSAFGLSPDGDADSKDSGFGSNTSFNNNYSAEVVPSPPSPVEDTTGENKDDDENKNDDKDNELAGIELARIDLSITDPLAVTTSRPPSRTAAARPASRKSTSSLKNQKTKNSLNKNKDRTSIAGLIAKLIDSFSTNSDKGEDVNVAKRMNILMMRQLDSMDRRMERHDKEERKEKGKKKKRQKKKRAKKRAKKAIRAAFEDQDDHGGKVGPVTADGYSEAAVVAAAAAAVAAAVVMIAPSSLVR